MSVWIWGFLRLILLHIVGILFSIGSYSDYIWQRVCLLFLAIETSLCVMAQTRHLSMLGLGLFHYHSKGLSLLSYKFSNWNYTTDETGFFNHLFVFLLFSSGLVMRVLRSPLDLQPTSVHHVSSTWVNCSTIAKRKRVLMHKCVPLTLNDIYVKFTTTSHTVAWLIWHSEERGSFFSVKVETFTVENVSKTQKITIRQKC